MVVELEEMHSGDGDGQAVRVMVRVEVVYDDSDDVVVRGG